MNDATYGMYSFIVHGNDYVYVLIQMYLWTRMLLLPIVELIFLLMFMLHKRSLCASLVFIF